MEKNEKKLFLLDAFALIYRGYFAFVKNPRVNSKGFNTSAVLGFTNTLVEILEKEKPTHIAVVFDSPVATVREEYFPEYKANREEMPEAIREGLPVIKQVVEAFNIPLIFKETFEADDIIGTLAKKAEKEGFTTYMMTPDKDYGQLISENIFMYRPANRGNGPEIWGVPEICEKFSIEHPEQVIDILGLWGDAVDNIPGIPGIGEKRAKDLIAKYGSVEGLIENVADLKGKMKENVTNFAEQGLLSKKLATIILDVPVEWDEESLIHSEPNRDKLTELFTEMEFRNLVKRYGSVTATKSATPSPAGQTNMFGEEEVQTVSSLKTFESEKPNYVLINDIDALENLVDVLINKEAVVFDTETTGLDTLTADLLGIAFSYQEKLAYYVAIPTDEEEKKEFYAELQRFFASSVLKIAHNIKYDLQILEQHGFCLTNPIFDTMIAHYLLKPDSRHSMDQLSLECLNYQPISIESLLGKKGKNQLNMRDIPVEKVCNYAAEDADLTFQLYQLFSAQIKELPHVEKLFLTVEMPLVRVLSAMEKEGINLDSEGLAHYSIELKEELVQLTEKIKGYVDVEFNIDSPKQLGEVLFEHMKITEKAKKTKTGQYATGEEVLQKLKGKHDIIEEILEYRQTKKLVSTYVDALPLLVNEKDKHLHTSYMQTVAATGRLSSNNPNLQNIPIRSVKGQMIRKAFIPRSDEFLLMAADYSQIELRLIAALSEDPGMIQAFVDKKDIHAATAAKVFGVEPDEVNREMRSKAKAVNFGIIYGQSAFTLAEQLKISRKEAKELIDNYFAQYGRIKEYMSECVEKAREQGYVETIFGRRRYLKDINSRNAVVRGHAERNAVNAPIQGSSADIIKMAMIAIQEEIEVQGLQSRMLLQVHDELVFDVHIDEQEVLTALVKEKMENVVELSVPLDVESQIANNWLEAH